MTSPVVRFIPLAGLLLLLAVGGCRGCQKEKPVKPSADADIPPQCGECLDLPTGEVCTVDGTMRNSCLAICMRRKIICNVACPCPGR